MAEVLGLRSTSHGSPSAPEAALSPTSRRLATGSATAEPALPGRSLEPMRDQRGVAQAGTACCPGGDACELLGWPATRESPSLLASFKDAIAGEPQLTVTREALNKRLSRRREGDGPGGLPGGSDRG